MESNDIRNEIIGFIGGILLSIQLLPQIIKSIKTKSTKDISYIFLVTSILGSIIMIIYGFLVNSISIIITLLVSCILKIILLLLKLKYDNNIFKIHEEKKNNFT